MCHKHATEYRVQGILWPDAAQIPVTIDLETRIIQYHGGPLFVCYICQRIYNSADKLSNHYLNDHRIEYGTDPISYLEHPYTHLIPVAPEKK